MTAIREPVGMDAADLLDMTIPPIRWAVAGLIPAGLGILASPPKTGKSLLCYQIAVAIATGSVLLGHKSERRHVRYYALEDGKRRSQDRVAALGAPERGWLDIRWEARTLGSKVPEHMPPEGALENDLEEYLSAYPDGVIIIDVLAKVRPAGGRGNAYDEDYAALSAMKSLCGMYPDAVILLVTHDRKAGSDDWMTRITGTRGVSGSSDFSLFIDRKRGEPLGKIAMTGRDMADEVLPVKLVGTQWQIAQLEDVLASPTISDTRLRIYDWLKHNGPAYQSAISVGTGIAKGTIDARVHDMAKDGQLDHGRDGYVIAEAPDWYSA